MATTDPGASRHGDTPSDATDLPPVSPRPLPHEQVLPWSFLLNSVRTNTLGDLHRTPTQLTAYQNWLARIKLAYGNAANFILQRRLHWTPARYDEDGTPRFEVMNERPLSDSRDYKVLLNDWPYGLEEGIVHLCVWMKSRLDTEQGSDAKGRRGMLSREAREVVDRWVEERFTRVVRDGGKAVDGEEVVFDWERNSNGGGDGVRVLWFKNWIELQSVRGIDHIHVLIRGATEAMVNSWLDG